MSSGTQPRTSYRSHLCWVWSLYGRNSGPGGSASTCARAKQDSSLAQSAFDSPAASRSAGRLSLTLSPAIPLMCSSASSADSPNCSFREQVIPGGGAVVFADAQSQARLVQLFHDVRHPVLPDLGRTSTTCAPKAHSYEERELPASRPGTISPFGSAFHQAIEKRYKDNRQDSGTQHPADNARADGMPASGPRA